MAQDPKKKKRKLPKDITERSDHEVMEKLFGKRVVKKLDTMTEREPQDPDSKGD